MCRPNLILYVASGPSYSKYREGAPGGGGGKFVCAFAFVLCIFLYGSEEGFNVVLLLLLLLLLLVLLGDDDTVADDVFEFKFKFDADADADADDVSCTGDEEATAGDDAGNAVVVAAVVVVVEDASWILVILTFKASVFCTATVPTPLPVVVLLLLVDTVEVLRLCFNSDLAPSRLRRRR